MGDGRRRALRRAGELAHDERNVEGPVCSRGIAVSRPESVLLDSDQFLGFAVSCIDNPHPDRTPFVPANGVVVDLHPKPGWPPSTSPGSCLPLAGITGCIYDRTPTAAGDQMAELDVLFVSVTVTGRAGHELLEIGLAGNGLVARTILYSIRAA